MSSCATFSPGDEEQGDSLLFLRRAITVAQDAGFHFSSPEEQNIPQSEKKSRRRTWWCCYVQDRIYSLQSGTQVSIRDHDFGLPTISLGDIDFCCLANLDGALGEAVIPGSTLAQVLALELFQFKVEICRCLSTFGRLDEFRLVEKVTKDMNEWHQRFSRAIHSQAICPATFECLCSHWESLRLPHMVVSLLVSRSQEHGQVDGAEPDTAELEDLMSAVTSVSSLFTNLDDRKQLKYLNNAGLWAVFPVAAIVAEIVAVKGGQSIPYALAVVYQSCMRILNHHQHCFPAHNAVLQAINIALPIDTMRQLLKDHNLGGDTNDQSTPSLTTTSTDDYDSERNMFDDTSVCTDLGHGQDNEGLPEYGSPGLTGDPHDDELFNLFLDAAEIRDDVLSVVPTT